MDNDNVRIASQVLECSVEACVHPLCLWDPKMKVFLKCSVCPEHTNSLNNMLWLFILGAVSSDSLQYGTESVGYIETPVEKMLSIHGCCPLPWSWNYISGH